MARSTPEPSEMTFFEHLDALRPHLVRSVAAIVLLGIVAFLCKGFLVDTVLFGPLNPKFPTHRLLAWIGTQWAHAAAGLNAALGTAFDSAPEAFRSGAAQYTVINTSLAGQFNLHMKASLAAGVALATPYVLWEFWRFVRPALTPQEIAGTDRFVGSVSLCFFAGLLFGYFIMAPLSIRFFANYRVSEAITNLFDIGDYLSTVLVVSLACALLFELPLLVYFLTRMGIVSAEFLRRYRRHALVALMIVAAIITPPDLFSLVLVAVPLYGLYELSIRLSERIERRRGRSTGIRAEA